MKNIKLLEILGMLDDEMTQKAIETNDAQKLKELKLLEKRKKNSTLIKYMSVFVSSLAVLIVGVIMINNTKIDKGMIGENNGVQISNPISEVTSIQELESYIGISLEKYQLKEVETMTKFNDDEMIQIYYKDGTSIRISKKQNDDNSGISGSMVESDEIINNVEVKIRKLADNVSKCVYATWNDRKYSYTYYSSEAEDIIEVLEKIV